MQLGRVLIGATISIDFLSHRYSQRDALTLENVECRIDNGEQVAIIGISGCGKSTLLHMMAGLSQPTSGVVRINGKTVHKPSARWNMMFQKASLFPWLTASENAALGLQYAGVERKQARRRALELLDTLGLAGIADVNVQQLSGGQQQRVALARSLATEPDILFLDEPFSALDTFSRTALQHEVSSICRDKNINLVMVTHDVNEAVIMADRVLVMARAPGRIASEYIVEGPTSGATDGTATEAARQELMTLFRQTTPEAIHPNGSSSQPSASVPPQHMDAA